MNVGIVIYSQTGHTRSAAEGLEKALTAANHTAAILDVETAGEAAPPQPPAVKELPSLAGYDALVFGSPVHAFSLAPAMIAAMRQIASLSGKRVSVFVTQHFPFPWMGGNRAVSQLKAMCEAKGAVVAKTSIINWSSRKRDHQLAALYDSLAGL